MPLPTNAKKMLAGLLFRTGLLAVARWVRLALLKRPCLTILCYHRITEQVLLLSPQCIAPDAFAQQLAFFKGHYEIWSLDDVGDYLDGHKALRRDAVVFTFDDGYDDNYTVAHQALLKAHITGTFFISAKPLLERTPYWLDLLSSSLARLDGLPDDGYPDLQAPLKALLADYAQVSAEGKRLAARGIFLHLNSLPEADKQAALAALATAAQLPEPARQAPETTLMTPGQALALQQAGHTIAAHSMTHPKFANLDGPTLRDEMADSIRLLREQGFSVRHFAYPFGKMADIGDNLALIGDTLQAQAITLAFTTVDGAVPKSADRYLIPRKVMSPQSIPQINLKLETLAWTTDLS